MSFFLPCPKFFVERSDVERSEAVNLARECCAGGGGYGGLPGGGTHGNPSPGFQPLGAVLKKFRFTRFPTTPGAPPTAPQPPQVGGIGQRPFEYRKKHFRVSAFGAWTMFAALQDVAYELPQCRLVRMERLGGFNISNCGWSKRIVDNRIEPNWLIRCPESPWSCPLKALPDRSLNVGSAAWQAFVKNDHSNAPLMRRDFHELSSSSSPDKHSRTSGMHLDLVVEHEIQHGFPKRHVLKPDALKRPNGLVPPT